MWYEAGCELPQDGTVLDEMKGHSVLNAIFLPPLERIASAKLGLMLWYQEEVQRAFARHYSHHGRTNAISAVVHRCRDHGLRKCAQLLKTLGIPASLKKKLYGMVRGIADETCNWIVYQNCRIFDKFEYTPATEALRYVDQIVWTSRGVVDYVETAKVLFQDEAFGPEIKYVISCTYCLETEISETAPLVNSDNLRINIEYPSDPMLFYFTGFEGNRIRMIARSNYNNSYIASVLLFKSLVDNNAAILYFWNLINEMDRNTIAARLIKLMRLIEKLRFDWLYILICQLNVFQQAYVFRNEAVKIITKYLDSAIWEDCFPHYARHVSYYLDEELFLYITTSLVKTISADRRGAGAAASDNEYFAEVDYDRSKYMLKTWWQCVPRTHKEYVIAHNKNAILWDILKLFNWDRHSDVIEFVLAYVDVEVKKRMLTSNQGLELCQILCLRNKLNWIDNLMEDMLPSEEIGPFKEKLIANYKDDFCAYIFYNKNADQFDRFLSWCFRAEEERNAYKLTFPNTIFTLLLQLSVFGEDTLIQFGKDNLIQNSFVLSYHAHFKKQSDFSSLDYFLEWYFESRPEDIRKFKRSRMFGEDAYVLEMLVKREDDVNFTEDELLKWFCSNDMEVMRQLRSEIKEDPPKKKKICV